MLYSTREKIPGNYLDFLSKAPEREYRRQCQFDINRTNLNIGKQKGVTTREGAVKPDKESDNLFERTQENLAKIAKEEFPDMTEEELKYFSFLMTNLCAQTFHNYFAQYLVPICCLGENFWPKVRIQIKFDCINGEPYISCDITVDVQCGQESVSTSKVFSYKFFPDKTMQLSVINQEDEYKTVFDDIFKSIISQDENAKKLICGNKYKENDPFSLLAMNCDQEKCRMVTAIERLSKANPYTMARMIHSYIKDNNNPQTKLHISKEIEENNLSPEAKENIGKIADELKNRLDKNGLVLAIEDLFNMVINFFLKIFKYFELKLGESAVTSKEFDDFCVKLNTGNVVSSEYQSNFTKKFLEAKERTVGDHRR